MPLAPKLAAPLAVAAAVASLSVVVLAPAYADPIDPPVIVGDRGGIEDTINYVYSNVPDCYLLTIWLPVVDWEPRIEYCKPI